MKTKAQSKSKSRIVRQIRKVWTPKEVQALRKLYPNKDNEVLALRFKCTPKQLYAKANWEGLHKTSEYRSKKFGPQVRKAGLHSRFKKGDAPPNKGKKQSEFMTPQGIRRSKKTRFKKGQLPPNTAHDLAIRKRADGYYWIRIKLRVWVPYHRYLYEQKHGKIPKGYAVIFLDRNRENFAPENLYKISRKDLVILNGHAGGSLELLEITKLNTLVRKRVVKLIKKKFIY